MSICLKKLMVRWRRIVDVVWFMCGCVGFPLTRRLVVMVAVGLGDVVKGLVESAVENLLSQYR